MRLTDSPIENIASEEPKQGLFVLRGNKISSGIIFKALDTYYYWGNFHIIGEIEQFCYGGVLKFSDQHVSSLLLRINY